MNGCERENRLEENIKSLLDRSSETLDERTRRRLEAIRRQSLEGPQKSSRLFFKPLRWITAGAFATACAVFGMFFWLNTSPGELPVTHAEDLEIITSNDHIDLFQNLDFYEWLSTKENGKTNEKA
jgi:hypothetical protein